MAEVAKKSLKTTQQSSVLLNRWFFQPW